jgi:membrane protein implicated in regulation of membrane protease activity
MNFLLMTNWWTTLAWEKQAFWSLAIVSSILLGILFLASLLDEEAEDALTVKKPGISNWFDSRFVLVFFTAMGWAGLILFHNTLSLDRSVIWSSVFGLVIAVLVRWLDISGRRLRRKPRPQIGDVLSTGEVLQPIPPHRNGFGKVQINDRRAHYTIDAITAGREIPRGTPVRVIDVIDDHVILVESLEAQYPGQRK